MQQPYVDKFSSPFLILLAHTTRVTLAAIFQQNPSLKSLVIFLPPCVSSWILADVKVAISPLKVYSSSLQLGVGFLQNLCFVRFLKMLKIVLESFTHSIFNVAKICVGFFCHNAQQMQLLCVHKQILAINCQHFDIHGYTCNCSS